MRHGTSGRRQRNNRGSRNGGGNQQRNRVYDSNGPDVRIRGTAHQIAEKYAALAKDAEGADNKVLAESYLQHAEHYQRLINGWDIDMQKVAAGHDIEEIERERQARASQNAGQRPSGNRREASRGNEDLGLPASLIGQEERASEMAS